MANIWSASRRRRRKIILSQARTMSDHRLDRGAPSELAFNAAEDPALLA
jgi:hypothetical protein